VTFVLLLSSVHKISSTCSSCPSGFTAQGDECYRLDTDQWINWASAKSYCSGKGGYLAQINSDTKRASAETYIKANINKIILDTRACDSYGQLWIGGTDSGSEGSWKWSNDNSAVSGGWYGNEPDQKDRCGGCPKKGGIFGRKKREAKKEHKIIQEHGSHRRHGQNTKKHWNNWRPNWGGTREGPDCMSFYRRPSIRSTNGNFEQMDECCSDKKFPLCEAACTATTTTSTTTASSCTVGSNTYNNGDTIATGKCLIQKCEGGKVEYTPTCPTGWDKVTVDGKEKCYKYGATQGSWDTAKTYCSGEGGHLAVVTSEAEQSALRTYLKGQADFKKAWLDGKAEADGTKLKQFEWKSGNLQGIDVATIYKDWCGEEPDDMAEEQCMGIDDPTQTSGATGTEICWSNRKCGQNRNPLCERCDCDTP